MAAEPVESEKSTMGFSVSGAPLWLFKALVTESKTWYNNVYWPTIVGWYRRAKAYDDLVMNHLVPPTMEEPELPKEEEQEKKKPRIKTLGRDEGERQ